MLSAANIIVVSKRKRERGREEKKIKNKKKQKAIKSLYPSVLPFQK